jgi:predicted transposase YbfD/YdcC
VGKPEGDQATQVGAATNEIAAFRPLLEGLDLAGMVVTADAMHTQRDHASFLVDRGADYLLVVKANQPALHAQLAGWLRGHWRIENQLHWVRDVDMPAGTLLGRWPSSAWHTDETDITALSRSPEPKVPRVTALSNVQEL